MHVLLFMPGVRLPCDGFALVSKFGNQTDATKRTITARYRHDIGTISVYIAVTCCY